MLYRNNETTNEKLLKFIIKSAHNCFKYIYFAYFKGF